MILTVCLTGCSTASKDEQVQTYAWPIATASPEDTVTQILAEKFAEEVDRLSEGKMRIEVYSNSILGGDRELLESCKDGDIPFVVQNTAPQVSFIKEAAIFDLPCASIQRTTAADRFHICGLIMTVTVMRLIIRSFYQL